MTSSATDISTAPYCCYRFRINAFQTILSNVNIVRSRNSLRVSGYFVKKSASATVRYGLRIFPDGYIAQMNKTYTFIVKSVNNTTKRIHIRPMLVAPSDVYYENESDGIVVFKQAYTRDYIIAANVIFDDLQEGDFFDFTITGMYLYEGAYINPPLVSSLDVKPDEGDIFLHKDGMNFPYFSIANALKPTATTRYRIIKLGNIRERQLYGSFVLIKNHNNSTPKLWEVKFVVGYISAGGAGYKGYLYARGFTSKSTETPGAALSKFSLTHDDAYNVYVCMTLPAQNGQDWRLYPTTGGIFFTASSNSVIRWSIDSLGLSAQANNTDTVIVEVAPTEGF